jgi:hypothetical protein
MPENTVMQPPVDKVQGVVGGSAKRVFDSLLASNLGGSKNDNC